MLWSCWIIYLIYTTFDTIVLGNTFDLMLVLAGPMILVPMPYAYTIRARLRHLLFRMTGAFLIDFGSRARESAFQQRFERWANLCGLALAIILVAGLLWSVWHFYEAHIADGRVVVHESLSVTEMVLLMAVMLVAGSTAGYALGRYCGNGLLPWHLERAGIALRRPPRTDGVHPIFDDLRLIYTFNIVICLVLSVWFGGWIFAVHSPLVALASIENSRDWAKPFLGLWALTLAIFALAVVLPIAAWNREIAALRARSGDPAVRPDGLPGPWLGGGVLSGTALTAFGLLDLAGFAAAAAIVIRNGAA